jgi:crotonobetainyl-CoA:carnitine CoA-transferase CaiB-like acyl-CoA transferase
MTSAPGRPLEGVRIISIEQFGAGPFATLYLADMGADVIKIEDPHTGGDVARTVPPMSTGTDSLYFEAFNRGKRSIVLDLKHPEGRAVFARLVASADAVFNNLRGDLVAPMGLTYDVLGAINPRIVCASLSGYGREGPSSRRPGYDALVQAEAGWAALTGEPGGPPTKSGLSLADYSAGLVAALGLMIALFDAARTGRGRDVDTSLYDTAIALLTYPATWHLTAGIDTDRHPMSAHPSIVPFQFFATADGYIAIACPKERFFRELLVAVGLPELLADARFATFAARNEHREALLTILTERLRQAPTQEWMDRLGSTVPCAPVRSLGESLDEPELTEREMLACYPHPLFGEVRSVGTPFTVSGFRTAYRRAPALDAERQDILRDVGYTSGEIAALETAGVFGSQSSMR